MTLILVFTSCEYILSPSQLQPSCPCKDPIYASVYQDVETTINQLPSTISIDEKGLIRERLVTYRLNAAGVNETDISKAQTKARFDAITLFHSRFQSCPKNVTSGSFGANWYVNLEGINGDKWTYDTVTPNILTTVQP